MQKAKYHKLPELIKEKYTKRNILNGAITPEEKMEYITLIGKEFGASDIHISGVEHSEEESGEVLAKIDYRVDGDLGNLIYNLSEGTRSDPRSYMTMKELSFFVNGLKTILGLKQNETILPQDGKHTFSIKDEEGKEVDTLQIRLSSISLGIEIKGEGQYGFHESLVIRIINDSVGSVPTFEQLSLMPHQMDIMNNFFSTGLAGSSFITSGPTGSGKSSGIQSYINQIVNEKIKVHTLEDPIEYRNPEIIQTQINNEKGLTWGVGLRSLMRQDPDVISVGEVRDLDTAHLFLEASMTGHMGLSTVHSRSSCGVYKRFELMGIAPFLIVGGITIASAQKLARRVCPHCKVKMDSSTEIMKLERLFDANFGDMDFSQKLGPKDMCFMIGDDTYAKVGAFEKLFTEMEELNTKIIFHRKRKESYIEYETKKIGINNKIRGFLKKFLLNNAYKESGLIDGEICKHCNGAGIKGRVGIYEFMETDELAQQCVMNKIPLQEFENITRKSGVIMMNNFSLTRLMRGEIGISECLKLQ